MLVELPGLAEVGALRAALERRPLPGQLDLVPAARTVLIHLDRAPAETDAAALRQLPLDLPETTPAGDEVDLPVVFDGPDLDEVTALTRRSVAALVDALLGVEFTVAFGGFAPGFGYLTGLPGWANIGVPRSGAADAAAAALGNRLVGNDPSAAVLEVTAGGLRIRAERTLLVAVTGASGPIDVAGRAAPANAPLTVPAGAVLSLGVPPVGLRSYLAVRGGIAVPPVLGSRSTDTLSGLGPAPLRAGDRLPVGKLAADEPTVDVAPVAAPSPSPVLRLAGPALRRAREDELPSEGLVAGAVQVPPDGAPVLFLADHPVTGGYPVLAVVVAADLPAAAQLRPGDRLRFRPAR